MDIAREWFKDEKRMTFHDPLAAVVLFHPEVCTFERGTVTIETQSPLLSGFTFWKKDSNGKHLVAVDVDEKLFFKELFTCFN